MLQQDQIEGVPPQGGVIEVAILVRQELFAHQVLIAQPRDRQRGVLDAFEIDPALADDLDLEGHPFDLHGEPDPVAIGPELPRDVDLSPEKPALSLVENALP